MSTCVYIQSARDIRLSIYPSSQPASQPAIDLSLQPCIHSSTHAPLKPRPPSTSLPGLAAAELTEALGREASSHRTLLFLLLFLLLRLHHVWRHHGPVTMDVGCRSACYAQLCAARSYFWKNTSS